MINVQFHRKTSIQQLSLYLDFALDESYTPKKLCLRAGATSHDLRDVMVVNLHEPTGWINIPLGDASALGANRCVPRSSPTRCTLNLTSVCCCGDAVVVALLRAGRQVPSGALPSDLHHRDAPERQRHARAPS